MLSGMTGAWLRLHWPCRDVRITVKLSKWPPLDSYLDESAIVGVYFTKISVPESGFDAGHLSHEAPAHSPATCQCSSFFSKVKATGRVSASCPLSLDFRAVRTIAVSPSEALE